MTRAAGLLSLAACAASGNAHQRGGAFRGRLCLLAAAPRRAAASPAEARCSARHRAEELGVQLDGLVHVLQRRLRPPNHQPRARPAMHGHCIASSLQQGRRDQREGPPAYDCTIPSWPGSWRLARPQLPCLARPHRQGLTYAHLRLQHRAWRTRVRAAPCPALHTTHLLE